MHDPSSSRQRPAVPPVAVIGGGTIGRALTDALRRDRPQTPLFNRAPGPFHLDLSDPDPDVSAVAATGARLAVIAAGITRMAACQADPAGTAKVNVEGTLALAAGLHRAGISVVWLSSDQVFSGRDAPYPDDAPLDPLNEYGRQKAAVEGALPGACAGDCLIPRLGKVYGLAPGDGSLLDEMMRALAHGREVRAAHDLVFTQIFLSDAVSAMTHLMALGARGTYNLCAPGHASRLDIALACARSLGAPDNLVRPISIDDLGESFTRPKRVILDPSQALALTGLSPLGIFTAVDRLAAKYKDRPGRV